MGGHLACVSHLHVRLSGVIQSLVLSTQNDSDAVFNSLAFHYRGSNASVKFALRHGNGNQNGTRSLLNISIEPLLLSQVSPNPTYNYV